MPTSTECIRCKEITNIRLTGYTILAFSVSQSIQDLAQYVSVYGFSKLHNTNIDMQEHGVAACIKKIENGKKNFFPTDVVFPLCVCVWGGGEVQPSP